MSTGRSHAFTAEEQTPLWINLGTVSAPLAEVNEWPKPSRATPHEDFLAQLGITQEEINL
ncbi:MAG TPA: hypothetical protein VI386_06590 [Candidatus Sulfotelmatobacter sp.]